MVATHEILFIAMRDLGINLKELEGPGHFNKRLLIQKYSYVIQAVAGFHLGNFNLYIRGPYSPDVANMAFFISENYEQVSQATKKYRFSSVVQNIVNNIQNIFSNPSIDLPKERALEAWSTYHYIRTNFFNSKGFNEAGNSLFQVKSFPEIDRDEILKFLRKVDDELKISYA